LLTDTESNSSEDGQFTTLNFDSVLKQTDDLGLSDLRLLAVDKILVLPVNTLLRLIITSADVIHSWAVPALGIKVDAVPGRLNSFYLTVENIGNYYGQCSEICGEYHNAMPINIAVTIYAKFLEWLICSLDLVVIDMLEENPWFFDMYLEQPSKDNIASFLNNSILLSISPLFTTIKKKFIDNVKAVVLWYCDLSINYFKQLIIIVKDDNISNINKLKKLLALQINYVSTFYGKAISIITGSESLSIIKAGKSLSIITAALLVAYEGAYWLGYLSFYVHKWYKHTFEEPDKDLNLSEPVIQASIPFFEMLGSLYDLTVTVVGEPVVNIFIGLFLIYLYFQFPDPSSKYILLKPMNLPQATLLAGLIIACGNVLGVLGKEVLKGWRDGEGMDGLQQENAQLHNRIHELEAERAQERRLNNRAEVKPKLFADPVLNAPRLGNPATNAILDQYAPKPKE